MALADDLYIAIRVAAVATSNVTIATSLNPGDTLNGRTLVAGDLVALVAQTNAYENGLYRVATVPARDPNFNSIVNGGRYGPEGAYDKHPGLLLVEEQTGLIYQCTSVRGGTLGTTNIVFTRLYASAEDIQDIVGAMFTGNTEKNIVVTYQDSDGTADFSVFPNGVLTGWDSSNTDIDGLISGTAFGAMIQGFNNGHLTFALRDNDANDGFQWISGGGNYNTDTTYDSLLMELKSDGTLTHTGSFTNTGAITATGTVTGAAVVADAGSITVDRDGDAAQSQFIATGDDGYNKRVLFQTNGDARWIVQSDNTAESGANAGSNFSIQRFADDGSYIADAASCVRSTGAWDFGVSIEANAYTVAGTALDEYIADTVGAMFSGNTENYIAVTYQDGDNTVDFDVDEELVVRDGLRTATYGKRIGQNTADTPGSGNTTEGAAFGAAGEYLAINRSGNPCLYIGRSSSDGEIVRIFQDGTQEGNISVSGTTVSYNGGHLARWSQWESGYAAPEVYKGTVLSNRDEMCVWLNEEYLVHDDTETIEAKVVSSYVQRDRHYGDRKTGELWVEDGKTRKIVQQDNEQLNRVVVSDVDCDPDFAGLFVTFDDDGDLTIAGRGDFICRIAKGETVKRGDLLVSAGNGCARALDPDTPITARIQAAIIGKVMSTDVTETYPDGSYTVPVML